MMRSSLFRGLRWPVTGCFRGNGHHEHCGRQQHKRPDPIRMYPGSNFGTEHRPIHLLTPQLLLICLQRIRRRLSISLETNGEVVCILSRKNEISRASQAKHWIRSILLGSSLPQAQGGGRSCLGSAGRGLVYILFG